MSNGLFKETVMNFYAIKKDGNKLFLGNCVREQHGRIKQ